MLGTPRKTGVSESLVSGGLEHTGIITKANANLALAKESLQRNVWGEKEKQTNKLISLKKTHE